MAKTSNLVRQKRRPRQDPQGAAKATVLDVARSAGVSSATVSRVLNGKAAVTADMRERVLGAVREMGFRPNPMAQGLRKGQTNTVALLVGDIEQTHFAALTNHVQATLEEIGLDLFLFNLGHSESRLIEFLERAVAMRFKGVILALSDDVSRAVAPLLGHLQENGILIVAVGQNLNRYGVPSIVHDERTVTQSAVSYLVDQGRRRIAYVGRIKGSLIGTERFRGYRAALLQHNNGFDEDLVWDVAFRYPAGRDAVTKALERGLHFDGIQAGSDELAMGALSALSDRGLKVPKDVAVIGFGGLEMGAYTFPPLTSVSSHPEIAAEHLREVFRCADDGEQPPSLTHVPRRLIRRQSA
jgi:DNA-binding LacI/PurR family transcriptional regulator